MHPHPHTHTHTDARMHWHPPPLPSHTQKYVILIAFHSNSGYVNAPQSYIIHTLPLLLNTVFAIESVNRDGKMSDERGLLRICVKGELISGALSIRILTEISLYP
jgi:hypothetical protein